MSFPCSGCGACCRNVGKVVNSPQMKALMPCDSLYFPYKVLSDGSCEKLIDNRCSVYEDRPLICNIEALGKRMAYTPAAWRVLNIRACNTLIDEFNIDPKYKIDEHSSTHTGI